MRRPAPRRRLAFVGAGGLALLVALGVVAATLVFSGRGAQTASAEAILRRAQLVTASPASGGITSLAVTARSDSYFLAEGLAGQRSRETSYEVWYEGPDRMRASGASTVFSSDGGSPSTSAQTSVWDGTDLWNYSEGANSVRILRQDPAQATFSQAALYLGPSGDELAGYLQEASACRTVKRLDDDRVLGRTTDVIELGPTRCGWAFAGTDGRRLLWIDRETGLILKTEQYSLHGQLFLRTEAVALQMNQPIDDAQFTFTPPAGVTVRDDRDQPLGVGYGHLRQQPAPQSLDTVRNDATFPVLVPSFVPDGYRLQSVEHWWGNDRARELHSHADWVLLRYADDQGDWLVVTQGFGEDISGVATGVPPTALQGKVDVNGVPVNWIDGNPLANWEPGSMLMLTWQAGRLGDGWEIMPSGEVQYGSPLSGGVSSNALSLEQLAQVAGSLR